MLLWKKTSASHRYQKLTIVEVYSGITWGGGGWGGLDKMFILWMIFEETKEVTLTDIKCTFVPKVHVTRIYTFHAFCRYLRILLHAFRGVGPKYYDITYPLNVLHNIWTAPNTANDLTFIHLSGLEMAWDVTEEENTSWLWAENVNFNYSLRNKLCSSRCSACQLILSKRAHLCSKIYFKVKQIVVFLFITLFAWDLFALGREECIYKPDG